MKEDNVYIVRNSGYYGYYVAIIYIAVVGIITYKCYFGW